MAVRATVVGPPRWLWSAAGCLGALLGAPALHAQRLPERVEDTFNDGSSYTVYVSNPLDVPVMVNNVQVFDCVQTGLGCGPGSGASGLLILPGQEISIAQVTRAGCTNPVDADGNAISDDCSRRPKTTFRWSYQYTEVHGTPNREPQAPNQPSTGGRSQSSSQRAEQEQLQRERERLAQEREQEELERQRAERRQQLERQRAEQEQAERERQAREEAQRQEQAQQAELARQREERQRQYEQEREEAQQRIDEIARQREERQRENDARIRDAQDRAQEIQDNTARATNQINNTFDQARALLERQQLEDEQRRSQRELEQVQEESQQEQDEAQRETDRLEQGQREQQEQEDQEDQEDHQ